MLIPTKEEIAKEIRTLQAELNVPNLQIAYKAKITLPTVSRVRTAKSKYDTMYAVLRALYDIKKEQT